MQPAQSMDELLSTQNALVSRLDATLSLLIHRQHVLLQHIQVMPESHVQFNELRHLSEKIQLVHGNTSDVMHLLLENNQLMQPFVDSVKSGKIKKVC